MSRSQLQPLLAHHAHDSPRSGMPPAPSPPPNLRPHLQPYTHGEGGAGELKKTITPHVAAHLHRPCGL